jgi:hypothetical protein
MRFTDFLKATVFLMAGEASALGAVAIVSAATKQDELALIECCGFWLIAGVLGVLAGRKPSATDGISSLLSDATSENEASLPQINPSGVLVNRLWPFGVYALITAIPAFIYPQIAGIGAAFLIFFALAWRKQEKAVTAIEERDGARFFVKKTSPLRAIQLVRTTGMRRLTSVNGASG